MNKLYIAFYFTCICSHLTSQKIVNLPFDCIPEQDTLRFPGVYQIVDIMPQFPGGDGELLTYFATNTLFALDSFSTPQSTFHLLFIVDEKGVLSNYRVNQKKVDKLTPQELEILRVLKGMPVWVPGKCNGMPVPVRVSYPLRICLSRN